MKTTEEQIKQIFKAYDKLTDKGVRYCSAVDGWANLMMLLAILLYWRDVRVCVSIDAEHDTVVQTLHSAITSLQQYLAAVDKIKEIGAQQPDLAVMVELKETAWQQFCSTVMHNYERWFECV